MSHSQTTHDGYECCPLNCSVTSYETINVQQLHRIRISMILNVGITKHLESVKKKVREHWIWEKLLLIGITNISNDTTFYVYVYLGLSNHLETHKNCPKQTILLFVCVRSSSYISINLTIHFGTRCRYDRSRKQRIA